jgi:hypothetical protein
VKVNRGHKAYARTEVAGASMLRQVLVYEVIRSPTVLGTA